MEMSKLLTCALSNSSRSEIDSLRSETLDSLLQVVNPQTHVVQRGNVHLRGLVGVQRLHEIDFNLVSPASKGKNILVNVFFL